MLTNISSSLAYLFIAITSLVLLIILFIKKIVIRTQKVKELLSLLFLSQALVMVFDISWTITELANVQTAFFSYFANAMWFVFFGFSCLICFLVFDKQMRIVKLPKNVLSFLVLIPFLAIITLLITSISTKTIINVSSDGVYSRGPYFYWMYILSFSYVLAAMVISLINAIATKDINYRRYYVSLLLVPIPFVLTTILQVIFSYNFGFVGMIASLAMYDFEFVKNYDKELNYHKDVQQALEKYKVANEAKTKFLFNMSHDIRTPMNAIIGFTDMAIRDINDKNKVKDYLLKTKFSSETLLALINDILDMSRIESGKVEVQTNPHNVFDLVKEIQPMMEELASSKNIELTFNTNKVIYPYCVIDASRVNRIYINIINNAIKYTNNGGWVHVNFETLDTDKENEKILHFICSDNGHGMSQEFQKHMFEEFSREENSTSSGVQGTGLGLSLCKALVDLMDGKIECNSSVGVGTTFTVSIPIKKIEQHEYEAFTKSAPDDFVETSFQGKRVLLAEDNALNREIVTDILSNIGLIIECAEDGIQAVDLIRKNGAKYYDFVLMDIQMPRMNGYEATKMIRSLDEGKDIVIIALSANAFEEDKIISKKVGMNDHIAKPINVKELFVCLSKYIK